MRDENKIYTHGHSLKKKARKVSSRSVCPFGLFQLYRECQYLATFDDTVSTTLIKGGSLSVKHSESTTMVQPVNALFGQSQQAICTTVNSLYFLFNKQWRNRGLIRETLLAYRVSVEVADNNNRHALFTLYFTIAVVNLIKRAIRFLLNKARIAEINAAFF